MTSAVEGFVLDAGLKVGAILSGEGSDGVDSVMGALVGEKIGADIGGERGVVGCDGDVAAAGELAAGEAADAEKKEDERGHEDGGDAEGAAANLLEVLAAGDEQHVTHRLCLPRSG